MARMSRSPALARSTTAASALALALALSTTAPAHAEEPRARIARAPVPLDGVAAVVDGVVIFRSDVNARARRFESKLSTDPLRRRAELVELQKTLLARMIDEVLFMVDAAKLHVEASDAEVSAGIASVAQTNKMDRKQLEAEVLKAGYSLPEYQEEIRKQIIEQRWLMQRSAGKLDRSKLTDQAAMQAALEKQRELLLVDLRSRAHIEVR